MRRRQALNQELSLCVRVYACVCVCVCVCMCVCVCVCVCKRERERERERETTCSTWRMAGDAARRARQSCVGMEQLKTFSGTTLHVFRNNLERFQAFSGTTWNVFRNNLTSFQKKLKSSKRPESFSSGMTCVRREKLKTCQ